MYQHVNNPLQVAEANGDDDVEPDRHKSLEDDSNDRFYKNEVIQTKWIVFHWVVLIVSIILFIICLVVPLTGSFALYVVILLCISMDCVITIFSCKNGICCKSKMKTMNQMDDACTLLTTVLWIVSLCIAILCGISDTASPFTSYSRWEEFIPIAIALLIEVLLCQKLFIRFSSRSLPMIYSTNYSGYHEDILSNSSLYTHFCIPCKWVFLVLFVFVASTLCIHSVQKSIFINTFNQRNTDMLTTQHFGTFEYQCTGTTQPQNADIRMITVSGMGSIHLTFGWYNDLIYNEYGINQHQNISICDYNRGGFGFTESKGSGHKFIRNDVDHLIEIADALFGANQSFHLLGHSRASLMLLQAKMLHEDRIESMVFVDGAIDANRIKYNASHTPPESNLGVQRFVYTVDGIMLPMMTFGMIKGFHVGSIKQYFEPELTAKYIGFRNYHFQSTVWEVQDIELDYENTVKLYNEQDYSEFENVFNIKCNEEYDETIWYSQTNNTLYVKGGHIPCVLERDIANIVFYYNNTGLKDFYDLLFV
eukprot:38054_1